MGAHFFLARCHTLHHIAHVMTTQTANGHGDSAARQVRTMQRIAEQFEALADEMADFASYYGRGFSVLDKMNELRSEMSEQFHKLNAEFHAVTK